LARELWQKHPTLRCAHQRLGPIALECVEQRLARRVFALAGNIGQRNGSVAELNVTRWKLPAWVRTSVETTIQIPTKRQHAPSVRSFRSRIVLPNPEAHSEGLDKIVAG
jgi:hypothetical protein